jgi:hypothetical protein
MLSLYLSSVDTTIIQRLYRGIAAFLGRSQSHHVVRKLGDDCARVRMYREDINVASAITTLLPKRGDLPGLPGDRPRVTMLSSIQKQLNCISGH